MNAQDNPPVGPLSPAGLSSRAKELSSGILIALLFVLAFALVARRIFLVASGPPPPGPGQPAPQISAPTPDGNQKSLAELRGQVVLVDFWATWCPPCVASMPSLAKLHRELGPRGFSLLGVNIEPGEEATVKAFLRDRGIDFPVVIDQGGIASSYGVFSFPTSFLVDQDGVIRQVFRGPSAEDRLRSAIEGLLTAPKGTP